MLNGAMGGRRSTPNTTYRGPAHGHHCPPHQRLCKKQEIEGAFGPDHGLAFEPPDGRWPCGRVMPDAVDYSENDDQQNERTDRHVDHPQFGVAGEPVDHREPDEEGGEYQDRGEPVEDPAERGEFLRWRRRGGGAFDLRAHSATSSTLTAGALLGSRARTR